MFRSSVWSYSLQEQLTDMNQNARYTVNRLSEVFQEAGANLTNILPVITQTTTSNLSVMVNPRGGKQIIASALSSVSLIPVSSAASFIGAKRIAVIPVAAPATPVYRDISAAPDTVNNRITVSSAISLAVGDTLYGCKTERYFLSGSNLCLDTSTNVLAENIEHLSISLLDGTYPPSTVATWTDARSVRISVRARTAIPDPRYKHPVYADGYRRVALNMDFRLKNKI